MVSYKIKQQKNWNNLIKAVAKVTGKKNLAKELKKGNLEISLSVKKVK